MIKETTVLSFKTYSGVCQITEEGFLHFSNDVLGDLTSGLSQSKQLRVMFFLLSLSIMGTLLSIEALLKSNFINFFLFLSVSLAIFLFLVSSYQSSLPKFIPRKELFSPKVLIRSPLLPYALILLNYRQNQKARKHLLIVPSSEYQKALSAFERIFKHQA